MSKEKLSPSDATPVDPLLKYFAFDHLPAHLKDTSRSVSETAEWMDHNLPDGPEKSAGMRKLLEAKDCFVRAALEKTTLDG